MTEIILHHYPQSPVSEKVRVALGIKGLAWRSVEIPRLPPKPDLMPLTGGYRLTPVMQIGADIYCDSQCILRELERRAPRPTLFPGGANGLAWGVAQWTDGPLFKAAIALVFADMGTDMPPAFAADRGPLYFGPEYDLAKIQAELPHTRAALRAQIGWLEERLATGRRFMLGAAPGLPDALAYYIVWFIRGRTAEGPEFLGRYPHLLAWEERVRAIGHGAPTEMSAAEALDIALASSPEESFGVDEGDPLDLAPGEVVDVASSDASGMPAVRGRLRSLDAQTVTLERENPRVGTVAVHFPRVGYRVTRA